MEGFQRKLLSVHLGMGTIQTGKEEVLPTCAQGTPPDGKPCEGKGLLFYPDLAPDSPSHRSYLRRWCIY